MKRVIQSLKTGEIIVEDIPCTKNSSGTLLIETAKTLVSAGTERMLLEFGKAGMLGKIKQQPDKVKMVLEKVKTDGLATTLGAVRAKLDQPIPLGYCNVGKILEVGSHVDHFRIGQRVISNGYHAEIVRVPKNLCARVPDNVSDEEAAFTVVAAIALQGIRLSKPTLGECYVVIGLGIIGLLTVQLLRAAGCRVLGVDLDRSKCELAKKFGADVINLSDGTDILTEASAFSNGRGVDAVIITAATKSNDTLHQAATMCRKRGRIILVGTIGNEWSRADFYEKELSFQVSCSYGPGRYDEQYEQKGQDYPIAYVRWTEQRNFEAVLDMMASGALDVKSLISHRFDLSDAKKAYDVLEKDRAVLGIILTYSSEDTARKKENIVTTAHTASHQDSTLQVGFIGSGNYGSLVLVPAFKRTGIQLKSIVSAQGVSATLTAKKHQFIQALTDDVNIYQDDDINIVAIATRHHLHAQQVIQSLEAGKHVFVEKPLALTLDALGQIKKSYENTQHQLLMVGFNRRFSPHIQTIKKLLTVKKTPKSFIMTVNAGDIPFDHWTQDLSIGGGRIIGEACHFIDLLRYLAGSQITAYQATSIHSHHDRSDDKSVITLNFADGSFGVIHYLANGHKSFPKERLEVFCDGSILQLNNFIKLKGYGWQGFNKQNLMKQNKGQNECVHAFVEAIKTNQPSPIPFEELIEVSTVTINIANQLRQQKNEKN